MTEDEKVIAEMTEAGIVPALRWSAESAHARAWLDFDPETGHNQTVLGVSAHALLVDRQDRAFRLEDYSTTDEGQDQDMLLRKLLPAEQKSLPNVTGVKRADLNNSPAWQYGQWRWFPTSFEYGKVHDINWGRKSPTKRKIAAQTSGGNPEQFVLPGTYDESIGYALGPMTVRELLEANARNSVVDLVLAHSINPHTGASELFLGRPRLNVGGGSPWMWLRSLMTGGGDAGSGVRPEAPKSTGPARGVEVPDAPVRLRPRVAGQEPDEQSAGR